MILPIPMIDPTPTENNPSQAGRLSVAITESCTAKMPCQSTAAESWVIVGATPGIEEAATGASVNCMLIAASSGKTTQKPAMISNTADKTSSLCLDRYLRRKFALTRSDRSTGKSILGFFDRIWSSLSILFLYMLSEHFLGPV